MGNGAIVTSMKGKTRDKGDQIVITGGMGFVGSHLTRYLKPRASRIAVLASGSRSDINGECSAFEPDVEYCAVDIRDRVQLAAEIQRIYPTGIVHLAGISSVDTCWREARTAYEVNVSGSYNVFEAAMSLALPAKVLNVSTSQVYGPSNGALSETSLVKPDNPYAATKAMAELLIVQYRAASKGGIVTARSFNHSGPGQSPSFFLSSVAKQFAEIQADLRPPKLRVGNLRVTRDFSDVRDVVRAYVMLLDRGRAGEIYNVCSGESRCLADVVDIFQMITGVKVAIEKTPESSRSNEITDVRGDPQKIHDEIGWRPIIPFERTLQDLVEYWLSKCPQSRLGAAR